MIAKNWLIFIGTFVLFTLTVSECPPEVYESGVGPQDEEIIVNKHNTLRKMVADGLVDDQPPAVNMTMLSYDRQLGEEAQQIADTCNFEHVTVNDSRWNWVGQNLYIYLSTRNSQGANWDSAIQSWFDEEKDYKYPDNPSEDTGHYTQLVWAKTFYVGCGYKSYLLNNRFYTKLYVCNYGPGGNILGSPPYETTKN